MNSNRSYVYEFAILCLGQLQGTMQRGVSLWSSLSVEVLLGYRFESLCDRIALGHARSKLIALEQGCSRKRNMQAELCLRILMNLMIPKSLMS